MTLKTCLTAAAIAVSTSAMGAPAFETYHAATTPPSYTPPLAHKRNIPAIFENFATLYPKGLFNASTGASLSGPDTLHGQIWLAAAFTPASNVTVKEIDVAAGVIAGKKKAVAVHIYADAAGIPGKALWSYNASLPVFGQCCAIVALADKPGLALTGGTQYWVGLTTLPGGKDTMGAWNLNVLDQVTQGLAAQNRGAGWNAGPSVPQFAFGIYGD